MALATILTIASIYSPPFWLALRNHSELTPLSQVGGLTTNGASDRARRHPKTQLDTPEWRTPEIIADTFPTPFVQLSTQSVIGLTRLTTPVDRCAWFAAHSGTASGRGGNFA